MPQPNFQAISISEEEWGVIFRPFVRTGRPKELLEKLQDWDNAPVSVDWFHGDEQVIHSINQTFKRENLPYKLVNSWTKVPRPKRQFFTQIHRTQKVDSA